MHSMVKISLILFLSVQVFGLRMEMKASNWTSSVCPPTPHCTLYQVKEGTFDGFGCSRCEKDYEEQEDVNGVGSCVRGIQISGCIWSARNPNIQNGAHICYECLPNWILSEDQLSCTPPSNLTVSISNCLTYTMLNGQQVCNACIKGYTLSEDKKSCNLGCSINNCRTCQITNGNTMCYACNDYYIGVINSDNNLYQDCLTCYQLGAKKEGITSSAVPAKKNSTHS